MIEQIDNEYRQRKGYGVTFSIEPSAYDCRLGDRVTFGDNREYMVCGAIKNVQPVLLDGKEIGLLEETQSHNFFHPLTTSFLVPIDDADERTIADPHYYEDEYLWMKFATLNQMLDYLKAS